MEISLFFSIFEDLEFVINITIILLCLCSIINSTEEIYLYKDDKSKPFYNWEMLQLRPFLSKHIHLKRINDFLLNNKSYPLLLQVKLITSILILLTFNIVIVQNILIVILLLVSYLIYYRNIFGQDGSDQMFTIILTCLAIITLFRNNYSLVVLPIYFIAFQITLAYFAAGVSKLFGKEWRKGNAVYGITNTLCFGSPKYIKILDKHKYSSFILTWFAITWETAFPIVLLGNPYIIIIMLSVGLIFHVMNAEIMGLNSFFFAFLASYPSLIYSILQIY